MHIASTAYDTGHNESKSKEEKNKKIGSKKNAHRGQGVRYRSW